MFGMGNQHGMKSVCFSVMLAGWASNSKYAFLGTLLMYVSTAPKLLVSLAGLTKFRSCINVVRFEHVFG